MLVKYSELSLLSLEMLQYTSYILFHITWNIDIITITYKMFKNKSCSVISGGTKPKKTFQVWLELYLAKIYVFMCVCGINGIHIFSFFIALLFIYFSSFTVTLLVYKVCKFKAYNVGSTSGKSSAGWALHIDFVTLPWTKFLQLVNTVLLTSCVISVLTLNNSGGSTKIQLRYPHWGF